MLRACFMTLFFVMFHHCTSSDPLQLDRHSDHFLEDSLICSYILFFFFAYSAQGLFFFFPGMNGTPSPNNYNSSHSQLTG